MAKKSILKNVEIRKKSLCRAFVSALENAKKKKSKEVIISKTCTEIKEEKIEEIFGITKG